MILIATRLFSNDSYGDGLGGNPAGSFTFTDPTTSAPLLQALVDLLVAVFLERSLQQMLQVVRMLPLT